MKIKIIKPEIFTEHAFLKAFFTLKNDHFEADHQKIKGLNLGFNTDEVPESIATNRRRLLNQFDINPNWIAFANQVHSNRVKVVNDGGTYAETDALITQIPGLALAIQVADCAAVLIADVASQIIAAVHAGWRGAAGDIIPRTLQEMHVLGARAESCKAFISPCISFQQFEVGQEVAEQFPELFVDYSSYKKPHVNLKGFLNQQLIDAGLKPDNIETASGCTVSEKKYYSYRREKEQSGRMMAIIQLKRNEI